jgi:4-hydroxy-2-oxoheptanedioate aldolase
VGNQLKARLAAGKICVNAWSVLPSTFAAEFLAQGGWDSITFDMQHGLHDYASTVACIQATQAHPPTPLVRVPWCEPGIIGKALDAGAWGVICPMINTAEEARALVRASYYPPLGQRSNGPVRAAAYGGASPYQSIANREVLILPQIETREAVQNLEGILEVEGISGIYVGPSDLGLSMGLPPILDREEPEILAIYKSLIEQVSRRNLVAGIQNATPGYAARMAELGFGLLTVASDGSLLGKGARDAVGATRAMLGEPAGR